VIAGEPATPLTAFLRDIIAAEGAITFERYMDVVLHHRDHGYYRQGNPIGVEGDFSTASEISQLFGEMIGVWCVDAWQRIGKPSAFVLLELGPGLGTMLQTAFSFTQQHPDFHDAMQLYLLESNATLRAVQQEKLSAHKPVYVEHIRDLPSLPLIVVANEFFDTLPLRQFVRGFRGWRERLVIFENDSLKFIDGPKTDFPLGIPLHPEINDLKRGWIYEISSQAYAVMRDISSHIYRCGGAGLIIDYGYKFPPKTGTLDALRKHRFVDVFAAPGRVDVTAGVDFSMLVATAVQEGVSAIGLLNQREFLEKMGVGLRAEVLRKNAGDNIKQAVNRGLFQLTSLSEMGKHKVLEIGFLK